MVDFFGEMVCSPLPLTLNDSRPSQREFRSPLLSSRPYAIRAINLQVNRR
jgi:hypothetical protein